MEIKRNVRNLKHHACSVISAKIEAALKDVSPEKSPGFDNICPEFLIHCGKYANRWLSKFFTGIMHTGNVPKEFKLS